jgi:hypothetical protein
MKTAARLPLLILSALTVFACASVLARGHGHSHHVAGHINSPVSRMPATTTRNCKSTRRAVSDPRDCPDNNAPTPPAKAAEEIPYNGR